MRSWRPRSPTPKWRYGSHDPSSPSPPTRRSIARSRSTPRCGRARCSQRRRAARMPAARASTSPAWSRPPAWRPSPCFPLAADDPFAAALRATGVPARARARSTATCARTSRSPTRPASRRSSTSPARRSIAADVQRVIDAVVAACEGAHWLVLAGSLPPGAGDRFYVDVIRAVRERVGRRGAAHRRRHVRCRAARRRRRRRTRPHQAQRRRARRAGGRRRSTPGAISPPPCCRSRAARAEPRRRGARDAGRRTAPCSSPPTAPGRPRRRGSASPSTVGAGDSSLAGYLLADVAGDEPADRLRRSVRYGAAAASLPGTQAPTPADLPPGERAAVPTNSPPDPTPPHTTDHWRSSCPRPSRRSWCRSTPGSAPTRRRSSEPSRHASSQQGRATDAEALFADAWAREQKDETGLPGGIAIPHAKSAAVTEPSLAFARLNPGVDFGAPDGPADLVFLIAAPEGAAEAHLAVLSKLARSLMQDDFTSGLRAASERGRGRRDRAQRDRRGGCRHPGRGGSAPRQPLPAAAAVADGLSVDGRPARIVAVTACATGIAHTFMAADALTAAGKKAGIDLIVEPQGSSGYKALPQTSSTTPMRSSSRPTSMCANRSASPASRSSARASSAASSSPTR